MAKKSRTFNIGTPAWIDFDPTRQREARNAIASLALPGSIDELGIGVFRDAISNLLFPGMTVTMTRAVYLALLPTFMYQTEDELWKQAQSEPNADLVGMYHKKMHDRQVEFSGKHKNDLGIIGNSTKDGEIQRLPWSIYWNALIQFRLIPEILDRIGHPITSLSTYVRHVCDEIRVKVQKGEGGKNYEREGWKGYEKICAHKNEEIDLTEAESGFIKSHITGDSLFAALLSNSNSLKKGVYFSELQPPADFMQKEVWQDAVFFNLFMKTAFAAYNVLLNCTDDNQKILSENLLSFQSQFPKEEASTRLESVLGRVTNYNYNKRKGNLRTWLEACYDFKYSDLRIIVNEETHCKAGDKANCRPFMGKDNLTEDEIKTIIAPDENRKWVGMKELDYRCYQSTRLLAHLKTRKYNGGEDEVSNA